MKKISLAAILVPIMGTAIVLSQQPESSNSVPTTLEDFFLPGSQPGDSGNLETPQKCDNCHGGYNAAVEPAFNWRGSMMAQAARDPLFYACLAISNQDAPESGDLCLRCHTPAGWLEGRSIPTDGSALNNNDREGVQCDFCHKLIKPAPLQSNPFPDDSSYTSDTYTRDQTYLSTLLEIPPVSANGMYVVDSSNAKRGPFVDAPAKHQIHYSPFHREAALCGTCHDVSNPAFSRTAGDKYVPNDFETAAPDFDPYSMFPIERTYSEWLASEYNSQQGVYAPQFGGNKLFVSTCQDCHMRDVTGVGCNKAGTPTRTDLPLHDMTGGNTTMPELALQIYPAEVDPLALAAGVDRARQMLQKAATIQLTMTPTEQGYEAQIRVTNQTGHKLPSGYPEGRRIWINLKAYDGGGQIVYESGAYDPTTGVLTHDEDAKIYEIKPGISAELGPALGLPAGPSFHFVLNHEVFQDNRIPPRGFTNTAFRAIQSPPVNYTYADGQYWDDTHYRLPPETVRVTATLYYQTTSKEYVEFLRDANVTNHWGQTFYDLWAGGGKSPPEIMAQATLAYPAVVGRQVFYPGTHWGETPAPDKRALVPGSAEATATLANVVSHPDGLRGIYIDIANLAADPVLDDFQFRIGNNRAIDTWEELTVDPAITVAPGAGVGGSSRVALQWPAGAIRDRWLEVKFHTDSIDDVFYFGSVVGETGQPVSGLFLVDATDLTAVRKHPHTAANPATIDDRYDINRDTLVDATDLLLVRGNLVSPLDALPAITLAPDDD